MVLQVHFDSETLVLVLKILNAGLLLVTDLSTSAGEHNGAFKIISQTFLSGVGGDQNRAKRKVKISPTTSPRGQKGCKLTIMMNWNVYTLQNCPYFEGLRIKLLQI